MNNYNCMQTVIQVKKMMIYDKDSMFIV